MDENQNVNASAESSNPSPSGASGPVAYEQKQVPTNTTGSTSEKVFHGEQSQGDKGYTVSEERISEIVDKTFATQEPGSVRSEGTRQAIDQFNGLDVDAKLAVLYYLYEGMGQSVTPAAPEAADQVRIRGFFNQFDALGAGDAQLEAMRSLVRRDDNPLSREYGNYTENDKLFTWFLLAERMGKDVIGIPQDYQISDAGKQNLEAIKALDFEQQITFLRDVVYSMGLEATEYTR